MCMNITSVKIIIPQRILCFRSFHINFALWYAGASSFILSTVINHTILAMAFTLIGQMLLFYSRADVRRLWH